MHFDLFFGHVLGNILIILHMYYFKLENDHCMLFQGRLCFNSKQYCL